MAFNLPKHSKAEEEDVPRSQCPPPQIYSLSLGFDFQTCIMETHWKSPRMVILGSNLQVTNEKEILSHLVSSF